MAPIALAMANHPNLEELRPLVAPLHHVGRHAGERERRPRRSPSGPGVRWLPAYGASELPVHRRATRSTTRSGGGSTRPACRPTAWSCGSSTSTPARCCPPGEVGEIQARSPSVMAGYLPDEANADAFDDGWYRTGDVGWLEPEGWVHLTDRSKEMIKVKRLPGGAGRGRGGAARPPRRCSTARCSASPTSGPARCRWPRCSSTRPAPSTADELQQLVADSLATYKQLRHVVSSTPSPGCRRARSCAAPSATSGRRPSPARRRPDGRPPLARAARPPRLGRAGRRPPRADDRRRARRRRAGRQARRRRRRVGLARAARRAEDGDARWPPAVEVALVAEELGRGLADAAFLGPTLAAELRRLAGAPVATAPETVAAHRRPRRPGARRGRCHPGDRGPSTLGAPRRRSCSSRTDGHRLGRGRPRPPTPVGPGRPHPTDGAADRRGTDRARRPDGRSPTTTWRAGPRSAWPLDLRRPRRRDARRGGAAVRLRRGAPAVRRRRSDRSRPCSTCWPTPTC